MAFLRGNKLKYLTLLIVAHLKNEESPFSIAIRIAMVKNQIDPKRRQ